MGNEIICTDIYRKGNNRDKFVFARFTKTDGSVEIRPAIVADFMLISVIIDGEKENRELLFANLQFFREYPKKNWYGINCPMKLWSTMFLDGITYESVNSILGKCSATRAKVDFGYFDLGNGRKSHIREIDEVMYVI